MAGLLLCLPSTLWAASYSFPAGALPGGCTRSGSTVTCAWYLTLNSNDVVTVTSATTLVLNGAGGFNGAQVNVGGNPANLTINVNGSLNVGGNDTRIVANINAANIYGGGGSNTRFTGHLNVTGQLGLGNGNQVSGTITAGSVSASNSSNVVINANVTTTGQLEIGSNSQVTGQMNVGALSSGQNNTFTGNIQSNGTVGIGQGSVVHGNINANLININTNAVVNGSLTSTGNTNLSQGSTVNGPINAGASLNASQSGITVNGNITTGSDANLGPGMQVDGNVVAGAGVHVQTNAYINGNLTGGAIHIHQDAMIEGSVEAESIVTNSGIIQGSVNSSGPVYLTGGNCVTNEDGRITGGRGCVNGYVNAPNENDIPPGNVGGPVCDQNTNVGPCAGSGPAVAFYRIEHSGSVLTCDAFNLQVRACGDAGCTTQPLLTGAVSVQAAGSQTYSASGNFSNSSLASLSMSIPVAGTYTLSLTAAPEVASGAFQCQGPNGCQVSASDAQLTLREVAQPNIRHQIAGVSFDVQIEASACSGVLNGNRTLNIGMECVDPDACHDNGNLLEANGTPLTEWPGATGIPVTFTGGVATLGNLIYEDAGRVRLHANVVVGMTTLAGESNAFVVRPDIIDLEVQNPYSAQVVGRAGDDLEVKLTARSRSGQVTRNFGRESNPELLSLAEIGNAVVPANGVDGLVNIVDPFVLSDDGEFTSAQVRYSEVGTAEFTARAESMDYLGTGPLFTRHNVGRFVPWEFWLENGSAAAACVASAPGFTYLDQPFYVSVSASARNRDGVITHNYPDTGSGGGVSILARDQASTTVLSDRVEPTPLTLSWTEGQGSGTSASIILERRVDHVIDGPFEDVDLGVRVNWDPNGPVVPMNSADYNDSDPTCEDNLSCNAVTLQESMRFVYGRLVLTDTFGPETSDVPVTLLAHFWDGNRFRLHMPDHCTDIDPDNLEITENIAALDTDPVGFPAEMLSGQAPAGSLRWSSPGVPGQINFRYLAPDWLKSGDQGDENPEASVVFGSYGGHDRVHSWQLVK